jgi:hypothetical protein
VKYCYLLILLLVSFSNLLEGQYAKVWTDYILQKESSEKLPFPDFSYAGYNNGLDTPEFQYDTTFYLCEFGAIADDGLSDYNAFKKTIEAVIKAGGGAIKFPKGRLDFWEKDKLTEALNFNLGNTSIALIGDIMGSEIFLEKSLEPHDPSKLWTTPYLLNFKGGEEQKENSRIIKDAHIGSHIITVDNTSAYSEGDMILISLKDNSTDLILNELRGMPLDSSWSSLIQDGVEVRAFHSISMVIGNSLVLREPLIKSIDAKYNWNVLPVNMNNEFLMRNLTFRGNWKEKFVHHENAEHDGGYSLVALSYMSNFRVENCNFIDLNRALVVNNCANGSILKNTIYGNGGHNAISVHNSTRIFVGKNKDIASQWHTFGVGKASIGNVFWRNEHAASTSFESHASQPRATLIDCAKGGFVFGRLGGARFNLPNHMEHLVLWNYNEIDEADSNFEFWSSTSWYGKVVPPIIVGFHGSGTTFQEDHLGIFESIGKPVNPESLYEAQINLRLGTLPVWVKELKSLP